MARSSVDLLDVGHTGRGKAAAELPIRHPERMWRDVRATLADPDSWLTTTYDLAMHLEHVLRLLEAHGLVSLLEQNTTYQVLGRERGVSVADEVDALLAG